MKNFTSIVDGFNIVVGTPLTNIAALIVLCCVIQKPPYYEKDSPEPKTADELNENARAIFACLIIAHFFTAIFRILLRSKRFRNYVVSLVSIFMGVWAVLVCVISNDWMNVRAVTTPALLLWENEKQYQFEIWLWLEGVIIWSYIFGTMTFLCLQFVRAPTTAGFERFKREREKEREEDDTFEELIDKDILKINSRLLDLFNENWTTCFLGTYLYMYPYLESDELYNYTGYLGYICVVQYATLSYSVFSSRGDEDSWTCYIKI